MAYNKRIPDVGWWRDQLAAGIRFREQNAFEHRWPTWRSYYRGEWDSGVLPINLFFTLLRMLVPRVHFKNPAVSIVSAQPGMSNAIFAQILERVDNKLLTAMKVKKQIKKMIQDTFLYGTSFGKVGFGSQFTPAPISPVTMQPLSRRYGVVEYKAGILPNMPWFSRIHPRNVIVPNGCEDTDDCRWLSHIVDRPIIDVKNDSRFKNTNDINPTRQVSIQRHGTNVNIMKPIEMTRLYEIRDRKYDQVTVICEDHTKPLYVGPDTLQTRTGFSILPLIFNVDGDVFWGIPDSIIVEPQQLEINEIRTQAMKHRRVSIVKVLYEQGVIEETELEKMLSEEVLAGIKVKDINKIKPMQISNIPNDLMLAAEQIRSDVREQMGFSRNQAGELSQKSGDTTATEASIVQMASEIRVNERQDVVADMMVNLVETIHEIIFQFWQKEQVIDLIGPGGIPVWVEFSGKMLSGGSFEIVMDADAGMPISRTARTNKAVQMYQLLKDNPLIDPILLTKQLLREFHGVQYDSLLRGLPQGAGQAFPMNVGQFGQMMQNGANLGLSAPKQRSV